MKKRKRRYGINNSVSENDVVVVSDSDRCVACNKSLSGFRFRHSMKSELDVRVFCQECADRPVRLDFNCAAVPDLEDFTLRLRYHATLDELYALKKPKGDNNLIQKMRRYNLCFRGQTEPIDGSHLFCDGQQFDLVPSEEELFYNLECPIGNRAFWQALPADMRAKIGRQTEKETSWFCYITDLDIGKRLDKVKKFTDQDTVLSIDACLTELTQLTITAPEISLRDIVILPVGEFSILPFSSSSKKLLPVTKCVPRLAQEILSSEKKISKAFAKRLKFFCDRTKLRESNQAFMRNQQEAIAAIKREIQESNGKVVLDETNNQRSVYDLREFLS